MQGHRWHKAILLVDMDAFFASIEQQDCPPLQGRPVVIVNGTVGSTIITCSYEARRFGVKTGMPLWRATRLCPNLICRPGRPERYTEVSRQIMSVMADFSPDIEIFSIDEAFLDVTQCQRLLGSPPSIAQKIKQAVFAKTGLTCSIGVSGDKTTAKYAAGINKPNGCVVIPPWQAKARLKKVPVTKLCGIGPAVGRFLAQHGVIYCGHMERLPIGLLAKRFGNFGRRLWYMCQGQDPYPVKAVSTEAKSMGHGKILPPGTCDKALIAVTFHHLCERLAARLRRHHCKSLFFFIGMRVKSLGWLGGKYRALLPTDDGQSIYRLCCLCMQEHGSGFVAIQLQVTALSLDHNGGQMDLFSEEDPQHHALNVITDEVNGRFGSQALKPAHLLLTGALHRVISPSWQPTGPRESIA